MNILKRFLGKRDNEKIDKKIALVKGEFIEATFDGDDVTKQYIETLSKLHGERSKNKH